MKREPHLTDEGKGDSCDKGGVGGWVIFTFVIFIADEFVGCDHVHETHNAAVLKVVGCGAGKHRNGTDATVKTGCLLHTHGCTGDLEVAVTESNFVQTFNNGINDIIVCVLTKRDTLQYVSSTHCQ